MRIRIRTPWFVSAAKSSKAGSAWIGASGWHYKHWLGPFYPKNLRPPDFLDFYARRLRTVEINNSFYRLPKAETFAAWRDGSPPGFCFAVKASRFITHMKKLTDPVSSSEKFFQALHSLEPKVGPILFQLPPRFPANPARLADFLEAMPPRHRYTFEFRDESWFRSDVYEILERHNAALCAYDFDLRQSPVVETADFAYVRLHGPHGRYRGAYDEAALRQWADRISAWTQSGRDAYCYFDNDDSGFAVHNAIRLQELLGNHW